MQTTRLRILRSGVTSGRAFDIAAYTVEVMVVLLLVWGVWHGWRDVTAATYPVRKDEWRCTKVHTTSSIAVSRIGAHIQQTSKCVQYTRNGYDQEPSTLP
jgi:hypothetical protein